MNYQEEKMDKRVEYLKSIDTGVVSDAMTLLGIDGWTGNVFPTSKEFKIAGTAFTMLHVPTVNNNEKTLATYETIDAYCKPGDVVVLAGAPEGRIFGGNLSFLCRNKGAVGVVIDGKTRDINEIEEKIPLFCRGAIIRPTDFQFKLVKAQVPVVFDGVTISPGDVVVGDRDGIAVVPAARVDEVIYQCEMIVGVEAEMQEALKRKAPGSELYAILKKKKTLRK
jgi:regulator of RNase E activity RraA